MNNLVQELAALANAQIAKDPADFSNVLACENILSEAIDSGAHLHGIHALLRDIAAGKADVTPAISSGPFVILYSSPISTWAVIMHRGPARWVYLNPTHSLTSPVGPNPISGTLFETDRQVQFDIFERNVTLKPKSVFEDLRHGIIAKDGRRELLEIRPAAAGPAFTLRINARAFDRFEWSFDRVTGQPTRLTTVDNAHSNLETILELLAAVGSAHSLAEIEPFLKHSAHHVRWKALETIAAISPDAAVPLLGHALTDSHPHVRMAAEASMALHR